MRLRKFLAKFKPKHLERSVTVASGDGYYHISYVTYCPECKATHIELGDKVMAKPIPEDSNNKGPADKGVSDTQKNDDKATDTGKPYPPGRPKAE